MKHLLITILILCIFLFITDKTYAKNINNQTSDLNIWIDSTFTESLKSVNIAGATIVLMQGDSILHIDGYGVTDIKSNNTVKSNSSIFGVGSISKVFVATAIMQLYEDGILELDKDINRYLKSFQFKYPFNDSVAVKDLLTHSSGFGDRNIQTAVESEKDIIPLAKYLEKRMPAQVRPAGKVISYSNHGYALLGLIVEEVSGVPFYEYIKKMILRPLEMNHSSFKRQDSLKENYVSSYLQKGEKLLPYKPEFHLYYPAGSFKATASDMGHFITMFLNNGNFKGNQILKSSTVNKMFQTGFRHYKNSDFGWLLGFPESQWNGFKLIGHGGATQGFSSQLSLIPEKNIGVFISVNSSSYPHSKSRVFIDQFINKLFTKLIPESAFKKEQTEDSSKEGIFDEPLDNFTGSYRYVHYARNTLDKLGVLIGLAPEIDIVSKDNRLEIPNWNDKLTPVSDLTFHSKYGGYVAFDKNTNGEINYYFAESFAYHKLKWYEPVKFQIFWIGSIILIFLIFIITNVVRKLFVRNRKSHLLNKINFSLASLSVIFMAILAYSLATADPLSFFIDIPLLIKLVLVLPFIIIPLIIVSIYILAKAIKFKELKTFGLIYQSIIVSATLFFIPWLMYYNLIGFNY